MAAPNTTLNSESNRLIRPEAWRPAFGVDSISSLQSVPPTATGQDSGDW